jgi:peroxisomal 2,4-dienoyl-CoA reductase
LGDVRDIAGAGVYLFSPAASFITGQVLVVDGGHRHTDGNSLPYPQSVLDPSSVEKLIRAKM